MKYWWCSYFLIFLNCHAPFFANGSDVVDKRETISQIFQVDESLFRNLNDDVIENLLTITPCSIPKNADGKLFYPHFPQCLDGSCRACEPIAEDLLPAYGISNLEDIPISDSAFSQNNLQIIRRPSLPITSYASAFGASAAYQSLPGYYSNAGQYPGYITTSSCPQAVTYDVSGEEDCSRVSLASFFPPPMPFLCPTPPPNLPPRVDVRALILEGQYCKQVETCSISISELTLRLKLLEEKLGSIIRSEAKLKVYTEIISQIQTKVKEDPIGRQGPPGDVGYTGPRGVRGLRGKPGTCKTPEGTQGMPGLRGPKGKRGEKGNKICDCDGGAGAPGFDGYSVPGRIGPKGLKGEKGTRGEDHNITSPPNRKR